MPPPCSRCCAPAVRKLLGRLIGTIEVESGSNDPMAISLPIGMVGVMCGSTASAVSQLLIVALRTSLHPVIHHLFERRADWK